MRVGNLEIRRWRRVPSDFEARVAATFQAVRPYTETSPERVWGLCHAIEYIVKKGIQGDVVECGVWKGGSMMAAARTLLELGDTSRHLYLFDTFQGMTDVSAEDGEQAARWMRGRRPKHFVVGLEEVRHNLSLTGYPADRVHLVPGPVENTLPSSAPERISLLRLDTDFYKSTLHELVHLFPRLQQSGVLIVDDYGAWEGARKATDEYLADKAILLHRMDRTGRIAVKS
jgi:hypothetical protein